MKFIQRLSYYLGGFSIGIIVLLFFLNGKDASCDYGPNASTVKNISSKKIVVSEDVLATINKTEIDTSIVKQLIAYGDVDFSESDTKSTPCKTYQIQNTYKSQPIILRVLNCDSIAKVIQFKM